MARLSFLLFASAMSSLVAGQVNGNSALPEVSAPSGGQCGGCYVVADVQGVVFGGIITQTATRAFSVGVSPNGTNITTHTSVIQNTQAFSFDTGGLISGTAAPVNFNDLDSTIIVKGATLTSPTSYEVFTAYSVTSNVPGPNGCQVVRGKPQSLNSAFSFAIDGGSNDDNNLIEAENAFIKQIGLPSCSAGGGNVQSVIHSMVSSHIVNSTTAGPIRPTPVAASTGAAASTSVAASTTAAASTASASATIVVSNGTAFPSGPSANFTVTPFTGSASDVRTSWVGPALALVCGAIAFLL